MLLLSCYSRAAWTPVTTLEELRLAQRSLEKLIREGKIELVHDDALQRKLERVGTDVASLASRSYELSQVRGWKWHLFRPRDSSVAKAIGGTVLVNVRAVSRLTDEELAGVVAHEVSHIDLRHLCPEKVPRNALTYLLYRTMEREADDRAVWLLAGTPWEHAVSAYCVAIPRRLPSLVQICSILIPSGTHPSWLSRYRRARRLEAIASELGAAALVWRSEPDGRSVMAVIDLFCLYYDAKVRTLCTFQAEQVEVISRIWSPAGDRLVYPSRDGALMLVHVPDGKRVRLPCGPAGYWFWASGGKFLGICNEEGVTVIDTDALLAQPFGGRCHWPILRQRGVIQADISPDRNLLVFEVEDEPSSRCVLFDLSEAPAKRILSWPIRSGFDGGGPKFTPDGTGVIWHEYGLGTSEDGEPLVRWRIISTRKGSVHAGAHGCLRAAVCLGDALALYSVHDGALYCHLWHPDRGLRLRAKYDPGHGRRVVDCEVGACGFIEAILRDVNHQRYWWVELWPRDLSVASGPVVMPCDLVRAQWSEQGPGVIEDGEGLIAYDPRLPNRSVKLPGWYLVELSQPWRWPCWWTW